MKEIERVHWMAQATRVYHFVTGAQAVADSSSPEEDAIRVSVRTLFAGRTAVFGHVFSECVYDCFCKSQFVVYAVVGDCLL